MSSIKTEMYRKLNGGQSIKQQSKLSIDPKHSNCEKTLKQEVVMARAEDEVVAVILSAIMGSIIDTWEISTENRFSELCGDCKTIEEEVSFFKTSSEEAGVRVHPSSVYLDIPVLEEHMKERQFLKASKDEILQSLNVEKEIVNKEELHTDGENEDIILNSLRSLTEIQSEKVIIGREEHSFVEKIPYMSLFEEEKQFIYGWPFLSMDSEVNMTFKQGNRFEGRLFKCRMHGEGKFLWADGSVYEGEFCDGEMTGEGRLDWPDLSWYEGEVMHGYRHGLGLFVQSPAFYCGQWSCGQRHGVGVMYYDKADTGKDYYDGEWVFDRKHGSGVRSYPSGAVHSGQWADGLRHGLGTMVWTKNDVFSGNWDNGQIHGYGEYTWATFYNNQLVVPEENCYYGNWTNSVRDGNGTLETNLGVVVRGTWKDGKKHGPAEVICRNGRFIYANDMFCEDNVSLESEQSVGKVSSLDAINYAPQLYKVPVSAAKHNIDLGFYSARLNDFNFEWKKLGKHVAKSNFTNDPSPMTSQSCSTPNLKRKTGIGMVNVQTEVELGHLAEEYYLRNIILQYLSALNVLYVKYSELCCKVKQNFSSVMMRLMFWQLLEDCNLHDRGFSLADFDIFIANNKATLVQGVHYPFERLQFWQFLHCLIEISWQLYGKHSNGSKSTKGVLASAFHKLITEDVLPNAGNHKGIALFKYKNLLSFDSLYWFYRGIGEPHSARKLLMNVFAPSDDGGGFHNSTQEYAEHLVHGRNVIGVGGKLSYLGGPPPLLPMDADNTRGGEGQHPSDLSGLSAVGVVSFINCLMQVCPSLACQGLIVNMDYKLVFLEFCEILLLVAKTIVKQNTEKAKAEAADAMSRSSKLSKREEALMLSGSVDKNDVNIKNKSTEGKSKKTMSGKKNKK